MVLWKYMVYNNVLLIIDERMLYCSSYIFLFLYFLYLFSKGFLINELFCRIFLF